MKLMYKEGPNNNVNIKYVSIVGHKRLIVKQTKSMMKHRVTEYSICQF